MNGTPDTVAGHPAAPDAASGTLAPLPTLAEATAVWLRIGCLSFGGAAAQIAMLHKVVVEEKRWVEERRFLDALNYCTLLPGPEAQQLASYLGFILHGVRGGVLAGLLSLLLLIGLALAVAYPNLPEISGLTDYRPKLPLRVLSADMEPSLLSRPKARKSLGALVGSTWYLWP